MQNDLDWEKIELMVRNACSSYTRERQILRTIEEAAATEGGRVHVQDDGIHVYTPEAGFRRLFQIPEVLEGRQRTRSLQEAKDNEGEIRANETCCHDGTGWLNRQPETLEGLLHKVEEDAKNVPQPPAEKLSEKDYAESAEGQRTGIAANVGWNLVDEIRGLWRDGEYERAAVKMYQLGENMQLLRDLPFSNAAGTRLRMERKGNVDEAWRSACEAAAVEEASYLRTGENPRDARAAALDCLSEQFPHPRPDRKTCTRRYSQWRKAHPGALPEKARR